MPDMDHTLDDEEDSSSDDDRASQLTYLSELIAHKDRRRYGFRSKIDRHQPILEPQQKKEQPLPRLRQWYPSFALASQFLFPTKSEEPPTVIKPIQPPVDPLDEDGNYTSCDEEEDEDDVQLCRHTRPTTAFLVSLSPSAAAAASAARMRRWQARTQRK
ncbi:hypothetical protein DFQ30_011072 [Apophysomyces sp. BC1015]|nr:hypothetical protein DFQ30_011072 [Apophysomyces sp. BC1015]